MSDPTTRSVEDDARQITREMSAYVENDREWRLKQAEAWGEMRATVRYLSGRLDQHILDDRQQFEDLRKSAGATSSIVQRVSGAREAVIWILGVTGTIVTAIWAAVTFWWDHK